MTTENRCTACNGESSYCATYIGPHFASSTRILFIGLDHGQGGYPTKAERAGEVIKYYRESPTPPAWNLHYKGCVLAAAEILQLPCARQCQRRCAKLEPESCALFHFAQANAVKCVSSQSQEMRFLQTKRIPDCLPLAFHEALELKPDLIILQSPTLEDVFYDLLRLQGIVTDIDEFMATVSWTGSGKKCIVLTVRHPSSYRFRGPWQLVWVRDVAPKLAMVRNLIAGGTGEKCLKVGDQNSPRSGAELLKDEEVKRRVCLAIEALKGEDPALDFRSVQERSTAHRLAVHLEQHFRAWNVDCEYDRDGQQTKGSAFRDRSM